MNDATSMLCGRFPRLQVKKRSQWCWCCISLVGSTASQPSYLAISTLQLVLQLQAVLHLFDGFGVVIRKAAPESSKPRNFCQLCLLKEGSNVIVWNGASWIVLGDLRTLTNCEANVYYSCCSRNQKRGS